MRLLFETARILAAALALFACGAAATPEPQRPARDVESEVRAPRHQREIPRLIAPPPAYGNKIVLAQR